MNRKKTRLQRLILIVLILSVFANNRLVYATCLPTDVDAELPVEGPEMPEPEPEQPKKPDAPSKPPEKPEMPEAEPEKPQDSGTPSKPTEKPEMPTAQPSQPGGPEMPQAITKPGTSIGNSLSNNQGISANFGPSFNQVSSNYGNPKDRTTSQNGGISDNEVPTFEEIRYESSGHSIRVSDNEIYERDGVEIIFKVSVSVSGGSASVDVKEGNNWKAARATGTNEFRYSVSVNEGASIQADYQYRVSDSHGHSSQFPEGGRSIRITVDKEKPTIGGLQVIPQNESDWYSSRANQLHYLISGNEIGKMRSIEVRNANQVQESVAGGFSKQGNQYSVNVPVGATLSADGVNDIFVQGVDLLGNESGTESFSVKVDNTAPEEEVLIKVDKAQGVVARSMNGQSLSSNGVMDYGSCYVYQMGQVSGVKFATNQEFFQTHILTRDTQTEGGFSDIRKAQIHRTGRTVFCSSQPFALNQKLYKDIPMEIGKGDNMDSFSIYDFAGNYTVKLADTGVIYDIDREAPDIMYEYPSEKAKSSDGTILYYASDVDAKVLVQDSNPCLSGTMIKAKVGNAGKEASFDTWREEENGLSSHIHMGEEGTYQVSVSSEDIFHQRADWKDSPLIEIDRTAPVVEIHCVTEDGKDVSASGSHTYLRGNVTATLTIREKNLNPGTIQAEAVHYDIHGGSDTLPVNGEWTKQGEDLYTNTILCQESGTYTFDITCTDIVGNEATKNLTPGFIIDREEPVVTITYDKNSPLEGIYYSGVRTATITVEDDSFSEDLCHYDITSSTYSPTISGWSEEGDGKYRSTVRFEKDGTYSLSFHCTDLAGNESNQPKGETFKIDLGAPKIEVKYDEQQAANGKYYKQVRTATISIHESSFDEKRVKYNFYTENGNKRPELSGWSTNKDIHIQTITFREDGTYRFTLDCTDKLGNEAEGYQSEEFIVDTTLPTVKITGVEDHSANAEEVRPVVQYSDDNISYTESSVTLKGISKEHATLPTAVKTDLSNGVLLQYEDFAHTAEMDDRYELTVNAQDQAGNITRQTIVFSVNRFGSVYTISDETQALVDRYYLNSEQPVTITETNVDDLKERQITYSLDGDIVSLKKDRDYTITQGEEAGSWNTYTYHIKPKNFRKEGKYTITLYSEDMAGNVADNKSRNTSVEFFVDKTAPDVMLGSVKNNARYDMTEKDVVLDVREKGLLTELVLCVNDKDYQKFSEEDLVDGQVTAKLKGDNNWQKLTVKAADAAGNQSVTKAVNILVTNDKNAQLITAPIDMVMESAWVLPLLMLLALSLIVMCIIAMVRSRKRVR